MIAISVFVRLLLVNNVCWSSFKQAPVSATTAFVCGTILDCGLYSWEVQLSGRLRFSLSPLLHMKRPANKVSPLGKLISLPTKNHTLFYELIHATGTLGASAALSLPKAFRLMIVWYCVIFLGGECVAFLPLSDWRRPELVGNRTNTEANSVGRQHFFFHTTGQNWTQKPAIAKENGNCGVSKWKMNQVKRK